MVEELCEAMKELNASKVHELVERAMSSGVPASAILEQLREGMEQVGRYFEEGKYFLSELIVSANIMKVAIKKLEPHIKKEIHLGGPRGKFLIGTVKGDLHDLGKNIVVAMLEAAGFEVVDLGINVPPEKFVEATKAYQPDIVGMSALLTTTMPYMAETIQALRAAGLGVKVMVGGGPVTAKFAASIGAEYAEDAGRAVRKALELIGR